MILALFLFSKNQSMKQETLTEITTNVMDVWYLDLEFLADTIDEYKLKVDEIVEGVEQEFWKVYVTQINYLIFKVLTMVAEQFIESHRELFEERSEEYQVFTNYLDSHVYFEDEEVQSEFERY